MTTTTIAALIWAAFALGAYIGYKIADTHWRRRVQGVKDSLGVKTANSVPLREGTIRKGGQNEPPNTPRPSTPPAASRPGMVLMGGICDCCHRTYSFGRSADRPYLCGDCQNVRLDVKV